MCGRGRWGHERGLQGACAKEQCSSKSAPFSRARDGTQAAVAHPGKARQVSPHQSQDLHVRSGWFPGAPGNHQPSSAWSRWCDGAPSSTLPLLQVSAASGCDSELGQQPLYLETPVTASCLWPYPESTTTGGR